MYRSPKRQYLHYFCDFARAGAMVRIRLCFVGFQFDGVLSDRGEELCSLPRSIYIRTVRAEHEPEKDTESVLPY